MQVKVHLDHRALRANGDMLIEGVTKEVLATNPDIGFVVIIKDQQQKRTHGITWFNKVGFVVYDPNLLSPTDSIVCSVKVFKPGTSRITQSYELLGGNEQTCVDFFLGGKNGSLIQSSKNRPGRK
jgi:hypothetical protein